MSDVISFVCPKCGNTDPTFIGLNNGKPYCRKCISFRGEHACAHDIQKGTVSFKIGYSLSKEQKELSQKIVENYLKGINTLVNAVCGAGKTELVYGVIATALSRGQTVCFAIPRRDVAIELFYRIQNTFTSNSVVLVCGGHNKELEADIVVCTTHQLFRYNNYFDLVILDEIDAFPYQGDEVLGEMFQRACRGHYIQMSATPCDKVLEHFSKQNHSILELNTRFHRHPLPVPKVICKFAVWKSRALFNELKRFLEAGKQVFIFVPTISLCEYIYSILRKAFENGDFVHSRCPDRQTKIKSFREGKTRYLVTTAVLERGVTVKDLQVIVYEADHYLYNAATLIQISGRVGRKYDAPDGEVIFIATKTTDAINDAIDTIKRKNQSLQGVS